MPKTDIVWRMGEQPTQVKPIGIDRCEQPKIMLEDTPCLPF